MADISDRDGAALAGLVSKYGGAEIARLAREIERANKEPPAGPPLEMSTRDEEVLRRSGCDPRIVRRIDDRTTFRDRERIKRELGGVA
jgi:hypothetical protein